MEPAGGPLNKSTFVPKSKVAHGASTTKKLVIKPLKLQPKLPENFEASSWTKLQSAVNAVHCKQSVNIGYEELYRAVQDVCLHKMADKFYSRLQQECNSHIGQELLGVKAWVQLEAVAFLDRMGATWQDYCQQMLTIRSIFLYLDRTYVVSVPGLRSLFDMGLQLFRQHLMAHPEILRRVVEGLLHLIERERQGEAVNRTLLERLLRMLSSLGLYEEHFQGTFLEVTRQFYAAESERLMQEADVSEYLAHCEKRLAEEQQRCLQYLDPATRRPLIHTVEAQLLAAHMPAVLDRGAAALLDGQRVEDLALLYELCGRIAAHDALKGAWKEYIRATGLRIVKDEEKDKEMVELLLDLKGRLEAVLARAFKRNEQLANALKEAFENFINQRASKPAELIAKFIDAKLRSGVKGVTEDELEAMLDKVLILFRYIQGKDVFEAFYKKDLAKRLLLGKSSSIESEKAMISKLKAECGAQFTNKLEGMFKDVDLSNDIMGGFKQSTASAREGLSSSGIEMNVSVLTSGFWPTYPIVDVKLPAELAELSDVFRDYYLKHYSGRRLVWYNSLGSCVLKARFPKGTKELSVSLFQSVVLLLFNDVDALSFKEMLEATGIADAELRRTLQSLACGKVRVLVKEPKGREVEDGDVFKFNAAFTDLHVRIKINTIQMKETAEENKKTNDQVVQDRQYQIDAALVRIMKMRKTLSHKLLVSEVLQQLKFPLKASDLKKRIESLIEREYLARSESDANVYNYLA